MNREVGKNYSMMNRRSFLKTAGAGVLGAAAGGFLPFRSFTLEEALAEAKKEGETVVPTFCGMCGPSENCGIYAFVKDGRFTRVAGMKESPVNRGGLCPKGQAAPQWVYSPDRLKYPLKRKGKKGEGKFERIGWDDAIKIIADKLKTQKEKYGPESLAMLSPARRTYSDYMQRFLIAHGSPNYGHSGICAMQRGFSFSYTLGGSPSCDYENAEVIVIWAKQPFFSGPAMDGPRSYLKAKARGAKIISIKPSVEPDVSVADIWVPVRPGTDAALALSMLNVIINEDLYDKEFVKKYCYGFDRLKEHVQKYPPEWGERVSGVPAKQIIEVSRIYAKANGAAIDLGNGVEHTPSSNDAIRSVAILMAITGNLNRTGGNRLGGGMGPGGGGRTRSISLASRYTQEMVDKLVGPEFPKEFQPFMEGTSSAYYRILDSVLTKKPYPIRTIIAPGTQPTVSTRGTKRVIEALKKVDFYVVVDVTRTAGMDYADIVVPVATPYEIDHPFGTRGNMIVPRNRVIEPLGEYKSIFEFFIELGAAMGYGKDFWNGSITECMNYQLEPLGITFDELRRQPDGITLQTQGQGGMPSSGAPGGDTNFDTIFQAKSTRLSGGPYLPHGKVEIYNTTFEAAGYNPLPEWREPPESITGTPELTNKYPLVLSDYHTSKCYTAAWQRNVPLLREIQPYPVLHIHPDSAAERDIKNDDWIIVESPHGWMKIKAELYPGIRPDTVMMLHGWWQGCKELGFEDYPLTDGGANVNNMYSVDPDKAFDPLVTAMTSQTLVQVRKA